MNPMKLRLIAAIVLLTCAVAAATLCLWHLHTCATQLQSALETALEMATNETPGWGDSAEKVLRLWEKNSDFLHILLPHANLNELEWTLGSLPAYAAQKDAALYIEQCVRGLQCVRTVAEMEQINLGNIF
ncbi:MAG: DUF4363 family protein [Oscillospiraceae bacterium]|jgi:hypothetical protein|nr:DUF4363 family protein [Oscillospiraceae bacterium]